MGEEFFVRRGKSILEKKGGVPVGVSGVAHSGERRIL